MIGAGFTPASLEEVRTLETEPAVLVDYDHGLHREFHTVEGALEALRTLFPDGAPASVLDVGCGTGTWLKACLDRGSEQVFGVDGAELADGDLLIAKSLVQRLDLNRPFELGRRFDLVLCLETVEHIEPQNAATIVDSLCAHGDRILFSAAAPDQPGTHHVNCRWPDHWQKLFNERGYACDDRPRWLIWENRVIEPWYRQNMFVAVRNEELAGSEPRIKPVINPDMLPYAARTFLAGNMATLEEGPAPLSWYVTVPFKAAAAKLRRRMSRRRQAESV